MSEEFLGAKKGEKILEVFHKSQKEVHKAWGVLAAAVLISLLPIAIFDEPWTAFGWVAAGLIFAAVIYLGYKYILWHHTVVVLTNYRVRVVKQKTLFKKRTTDLDLGSIESTSTETPGFLGTILKFGTLNLTTAAGEMTILNLKDPDDVSAAIQEAKKKVKGDYEPEGEIIFDDGERIEV